MLYAIFGWAVEVFFTGVLSVISGGVTAASLTYLWMAPIWGLGGLVFEKAAVFLKNRGSHIWFRVLVYTSAIMIIEYSAGATIEAIIGQVPWDYSSDTDLHINGFIRLDYLPFWAICAIVMERFTLFVNNLRIELGRLEDLEDKIEIDVEVLVDYFICEGCNRLVSRERRENHKQICT